MLRRFNPRLDIPWGHSSEPLQELLELREMMGVRGRIEGGWKKLQ